MAGFEIDTDYRRSAYDTKQMSASSIEKGANELTGVLGLCVHTRKTQVSHSIWMQMVHTHILQPTISPDLLFHHIPRTAVCPLPHLTTTDTSASSPYTESSP